MLAYLIALKEKILIPQISDNYLKAYATLK